jgi:hypothetical protein
MLVRIPIYLAKDEFHTNPFTGQTTAQGEEPPSSAEDPSDFLARERAALGDDAAQFASASDNVATVADAESEDDDDLLGGGGGGQTNGNTGGEEMDMMGDFETSFPAVDTANEGVAPGGTVTGSAIPYRAPSTSYEVEEDSAPLREWRERRDLQIQHIDERSAAKKSETVKAAQEAIDEFYENYNNRKDKQVAQTRKEAEEFLKNREDTTSGGTSWERIAKLVDLSGKGAAGGASGTNKARMRELLLSLRKDEKAPGATGY